MYNLGAKEIKFMTNYPPIGDQPPLPEERREPPTPTLPPEGEPPPPHEPEDPPPSEQPPIGDPAPSSTPIGDPPGEGRGGIKM